MGVDEQGSGTRYDVGELKVKCEQNPALIVIIIIPD